MTTHGTRLVDRDEGPDFEYGDIGPHQRWTLNVDEHGDLEFDDTTKRLRTVHGTEAIRQSLLVAIATWKGEDPVDEEFGLDVFEATGRFVGLEREIRKTLKYDDYRHNRVDRVVEVSILRSGRSRHVHVDVEVELDTGEIEHLVFNWGGL